MDTEYKKGLVSVGIPTYNRPESLKRALAIITTQTYLDIGVIVSDNASPSCMVKEVVEEYSLRDQRVKYYRQDCNLGVLANANFVLKKSHGEYFMWFSDDDWRSPEFIEILVAELEKNNNIGMAFCDYSEVYEDGCFAVGYPKSHLGIFKPFTSRFRLVRRIAYYFQNAANGKCNLFYSLFRKKAIDALDLKEISGGFNHLNMDCLIVYAMLRRSPALIREEKMCTLTCCNKKHYLPDGDSKSNRSIVDRLLSFIFEQKTDRDLFIKNSDLMLEKVIIYVGFLPRLIFLLASIFIKKMYFHCKHNTSDEAGIHDKEKSLRLSLSYEGCKPKNKMLKLPGVTLIAMATRNVEETLQALFYSSRDIEFGSVRLVSHYTPYGLSDEVEFFKIDKCKSIDEWSYKIIYELNEYIETEFALLVHADGFVVNPSSWRDEFLDYDYIGAPFPLPSDDFSYRDIHGNIVRVGNSVSLRSKRLLELPIKLQLPWEPYHGFYNEDGFICAKNRHIYESNGIKFAPLEVAKYFSHEAMIPEVKNIKPFAFHKWAGANRNYPKF
jgi:glycosyltransferase involved in cell wall biosynthesis